MLSDIFPRICILTCKRASFFRCKAARRVETTGVEPATPGLQSRCSPIELRPPNPQSPQIRISALHPEKPKSLGPGRFELPTSRLSGVRSNQLSYEPERLYDNDHQTPTGRQFTYAITKEQEKSRCLNCQRPGGLQESPADSQGENPTVFAVISKTLTHSPFVRQTARFTLSY